MLITFLSKSKVKAFLHLTGGEKHVWKDSEEGFQVGKETSLKVGGIFFS